MVKFNILTANKLFSDRNFLELQDRRLEQIKILSNLYQESPLKISERIESIDNYYRRKTGELDKSKNKTIDNNTHLQEGEKENDNVSELSTYQKKIKNKNENAKKNINDTLKSIGSLTDADNNKNTNNLISTNEKTDKKVNKSLIKMNLKVEIFL